MGDTTPEAFQKIVQFLYSGKIDVHLLDKDLVLEILRLAHRYGIDELVRLLSKETWLHYKNTNDKVKGSSEGNPFHF